MASIRLVKFRNEYIYHIYNRGVERRPIFLSTLDRERFTMLLEYYRFQHVPKSFSQYLDLPISERMTYFESLQSLPHAIDILAYCLMPNHFHLLIRQKKDQGIVDALSIISNSYAKYFNVKDKRVGPLFQGPFKAVRIESDEQLMHVSRYIHINPVTNGVIDESALFSFPWSSLPVYVGQQSSRWIEHRTITDLFRSRNEYRKFVIDQIDYGKKLEMIKHVVLEEV